MDCDKKFHRILTNWESAEILQSIRVLIEVFLRKWSGSNTLVDCPRNWKSKSHAYDRNQIQAAHLRLLGIDHFADNDVAW